MLRGCQEPFGSLQTTLPSRLVALPLSTLPSADLTPVLLASPSGTLLGTEGGDSQPLDSVELEMWLGKLALSIEEGLRLRGAF